MSLKPNSFRSISREGKLRIWNPCPLKDSTLPNDLLEKTGGSVMWLDLVRQESIWKIMETVGVDWKEFSKRDATVVKN